jgi:hypothetical protein
VLIAEHEQPLLEILKSSVGFAMKVMFLKHEFSVHD